MKDAKPRLEITDAIVIRDGKFLVVTNRSVGNGKFTCPGGKIHEDEASDEAAKRELTEETGLVASCAQRIGRFEYPWHGQQIGTTAFLMSVDQNQEPRATEEGTEIFWVDRDELLEVGPEGRSLSPAFYGWLMGQIAIVGEIPLAARGITEDPSEPERVRQQTRVANDGTVRCCLCGKKHTHDGDPGDKVFFSTCTACVRLV